MLDEDKTLIGDDKNSTIGTELFARRSMPRYEKTTVTVKAEDGTTSDIEVYKYNEEDPEDTYSLYTIGQLVMNPTVLQDFIYHSYQVFRDQWKIWRICQPGTAGLRIPFNEKLGTLT